MNGRESSQLTQAATFHFPPTINYMEQIHLLDGYNVEVLLLLFAYIDNWYLSWNKCIEDPVDWSDLIIKKMRSCPGFKPEWMSKLFVYLAAIFVIAEFNVEQAYDYEIIKKFAIALKQKGYDFTVPSPVVCFNYISVFRLMDQSSCRKKIAKQVEPLYTHMAISPLPLLDHTIFRRDGVKGKIYAANPNDILAGINPDTEYAPSQKPPISVFPYKK